MPLDYRGVVFFINKSKISVRKTGHHVMREFGLHMFYFTNLYIFIDFIYISQFIFQSFNNLYLNIYSNIIIFLSF